MKPDEKPTSFISSASQYILDNFEGTDRIAMLILHRGFGETIQRITNAQKAASREFQAWLRYKNANGSDIYIGMNPLKKDAATRTKQDIDSIKHVYLDLDHGGSEALETIQNSTVVPRPSYVLNSSPDKHQVVWKVEGMSLEEAEALLHAMAHAFGADRAATDATRVLRVPGFFNKKYQKSFYIEARTESTETYHLRDFKLHLNSHNSPRHDFDDHAQKKSSPGVAPSQSERDWAFAKRALARGDDPETIIRQIAEHRAQDKYNPEDYARRTVLKAKGQLLGVPPLPDGVSLSPNPPERE